jgi:transcriptional regulator with XRE-family HTH domain
MSVALGKKIKAVRRLKRMTQQNLADKIGISVSQLSCIERGSKYPRQEVLMEIAEILDISPYEFFILPDHIKQHALGP